MRDVSSTSVYDLTGRDHILRRPCIDLSQGALSQRGARRGSAGRPGLRLACTAGTGASTAVGSSRVAWSATRTAIGRGRDMRMGNPRSGQARIVCAAGRNALVAPKVPRASYSRRGAARRWAAASPDAGGPRSAHARAQRRHGGHAERTIVPSIVRRRRPGRAPH